MKKGAKGKKVSAKKKKQEPLPKALKPIGVWVWAQCDNAGCQKWRKLPPGTVLNDDEPWWAQAIAITVFRDCHSHDLLPIGAIEVPSNSWRSFDMTRFMLHPNDLVKQKTSTTKDADPEPCQLLLASLY